MYLFSSSCLSVCLSVRLFLEQMQVRHELRRRFPRRPWLDVVSKADIPRLELEKAKEALPDGYLDVSTLDGTGVDELKSRYSSSSRGMGCCGSGEEGSLLHTWFVW